MCSLCSSERSPLNRRSCFPGNLTKTCTTDGWSLMLPVDIAANCGYNHNISGDEVRSHTPADTLRGPATALTHRQTP